MDCELRDAIGRMEKNKFRCVFVVDHGRQLLGIVTHGDLRRHIMEGGRIDGLVTDCMNTDFQSVIEHTGREEILKLLDLGLHVIPKTDSDGCLVDFITKDHNPPPPESAVLARARAPVRISFGGGGSDVTYYFVEHPAAVLSTSITLYSHATLVPRKDTKIGIHSEDLGRNDFYSSFEDLLKNKGEGLLQSIVSVIKPKYGFDLYVRTDIPLCSGLGGSSAVATSVVAAFNEMRTDKWSTYEIAELSFQAERVCFGVAGGWQDQYASAFGGFNLIELGSNENLVHALRIEADILNELEECLILCDTCLGHDSGELHKEQKNTYRDDANTDAVADLVDLCRELHKHLIRGDLLKFGSSLGRVWQLKKSLSKSVSNNKIDSIYDAAIAAGASGGKLLGAGAGGFFLFFVSPEARQPVVTELASHGCKLTNFRFEHSGVTSWKTRVM